jgi:transitional endoplasmic reticulum ATPase
MDSLNASTGDILEISADEKSKSARKKTVAKCLPLYPSDEGKGIIRIEVSLEIMQT